MFELDGVLVLYYRLTKLVFLFFIQNFSPLIVCKITQL